MQPPLHRGVALQMWNVPITSKEIRTVYIIDIINNKYIDNIYINKFNIII